MTIYVLRNVRDARILAVHYGIDVPEAQGRFPIKRLQDHATAQGDTVVIKNWEHIPNSNIGQQRYHVTALVQEGQHKVPRETVTALQDVRNWARLQGKRGRVSFDTIARATVAMNHWNKAEIVSVDRID